MEQLVIINFEFANKDECEMNISDYGNREYGIMMEAKKILATKYDVLDSDSEDSYIAIETEDQDGVEELIRWVSFFDFVKIRIGCNSMQRTIEFIVKYWKQSDFCNFSS